MNDNDGLDPRLQQLYRQLPKVEPDATLDAHILNAARQHLSKRASWHQPFALAASVVMVGSLVLYWRAEQPVQLEQAVSIAKESAPAPAVPAALPEPSTSTQPPAAAPAKPPAVAERAAKSKATTNSLENDLKLLRSMDNVESEHKARAYGGSYSKLAERTLKDEKVAVGAIGHSAPEADEAAAKASLAPAPVVAETVAPAAPAVMAQRVEKIETDKIEQEPSTDALALRQTQRLKTQQAPAPLMAQRARLAAEEAKARLLSTSHVQIEGISLGMTGEQLQAMGFSCANDVCRKQLSQPEQASYWGIPSLNAQLNVFMGQNLASKLVLEQTLVDLTVVQSALAQLGQVTDKVCVEEKGLFASQRIIANEVFLLRQQGHGVELTVCRAP